MNAPVQNLDAEKAVLGALMTGAPVVDDVADVLQGRDFYRPNHEQIFDACLTVHRRGDKVDPILVHAQLGADAEKVGGAPYLHTLTSDLPHTGNALLYAQQVVDAALCRRLVDAGTRIIQRATSGGDALQLAEDAKQEVETASSHARTAEAGTSVGDGIAAAIDWLETPPVGADTPWVEVNHKTNGLLAGQMVTVAARPGHGKSLVAKDVALHTALRLGRPVHIATLEMSRNEYMARILAGLAAVNLGNMLRRQMSDHEWAAVARASEQLRGVPLYLDDRERQSIAQIRAAARQTQRRFGKPLGLIAIDYAQLVMPANPGHPSREQQVAQISRDVKLLAKEMGCPVMLLAQLNRNNTQRSDPTPQVSDLRESGSLEQDSDQVWLLHRPDQYTEERMGEVDLIVGKNRNGSAPLKVALSFQGHLARVVEFANG